MGEPTEDEPTEFASPTAFVVHCMRNAKRIFVRAHIEGKWATHSLASLPADLQTFYIEEWMKNGILPVMLRGDDVGE
jgi:hypothetical protein